MGDMADLALEQAEFAGDWGFPPSHDPREFWLTQFNGWIKITDMTTQHLESTCAMLERYRGQDNPSYFALVEELEKRNVKV